MSHVHCSLSQIELDDWQVDEKTLPVANRELYNLTIEHRKTMTRHHSLRQGLLSQNIRGPQNGQSWHRTARFTMTALIAVALLIGIVASAWHTAEDKPARHLPDEKPLNAVIRLRNPPRPSDSLLRSLMSGISVSRRMPFESLVNLSLAAGAIPNDPDFGQQWPLHNTG